MNRKALQSKIDNISVQLYTTGREIENDSNAIKGFVADMLKNISFQLDTLVEFLNAKGAELDAYEKRQA